MACDVQPSECQEDRLGIRHESLLQDRRVSFTLVTCDVLAVVCAFYYCCAGIRFKQEYLLDVG